MKNIYFDNRWPVGGGIHVVAREIGQRLSAWFSLQDLHVQGRIGGLTSFWSVTAALNNQSVGRNDIFWNPGFIPPAYTRASKVVTVHDLTHLRYYSAAHRLYYDFVFKPLYKRCDRIVCVSQYTKNEFCEWSGIAPDRVDVVLNGVSGAFGSAVPATSRFGDYVFYPGNYREYKNLRRLLNAYAASRLPASGVRLAMTGSGNEELKAQIDALGITPHVVFLGYLSAEELIASYRASKGVAFVSLYEGFGLPILEGMASGVPVLTSSVSSMPEIAGDAAIVVDPTSEEAIRDGLESMMFDSALRSELVRKGLARIPHFGWDSAALQVKQLMDSL